MPEQIICHKNTSTRPERRTKTTTKSKSAQLDQWRGNLWSLEKYEELLLETLARSLKTHMPLLLHLQHVGSEWLECREEERGT